jgi:hypothetical protein
MTYDKIGNALSWQSFLLRVCLFSPTEITSGIAHTGRNTD